MTVQQHPESGRYFIAPPGFDPDTDMGAALCSPLPAYMLPAYTPIVCGFTQSTTLPDMDFETYSEAGYWWDQSANKGLGRWRSVSNGEGGIFAVGAPVYSEHPSTEVLSLAYNLKDGKGERLWLPGMPPPQDLFDHIASGGLVEAHNSGFEWLIWTNVCWRRMGWPPLPLGQLRCSASKSRAFSIPGSLEKGGDALLLDITKDKDGKRLIKKFSVPRSPTKKDPRTRIDPMTDSEDGPKLYSYNIQDTRSESELSAHVPDLQPQELDLWLVDQRINMRGVQIDMEGVDNCLAIFEQASHRLNLELSQLTGGRVAEASKVRDLTEWLGCHGLYMPDMQADTIDGVLSNDSYPGLNSATRRALEIRAILGSASVKKLYALRRQTSYDNRLRELFKFCGADRTGRFAGQGAQPQNMPSSGPDLHYCECGRYYSPALNGCPWCGLDNRHAKPSVEWNIDALEQALRDLYCRDYDRIAQLYGDPVKLIAGCLRGLFCAAPNHDLICSDYSAIEAVVLAALAREEWRLEVFRTHGKIYEMSAAKITGIPFDEFMRHKEETGDHHPMRKKVGKVAELASGYQGGKGAWKAFGADKFMTDDEIADNVKLWRNESPNIVRFWYAMEDCAVNAVKFPGNTYQHNGIAFCVRDGVLYCRLLSGRLLAYHRPMITPDVTPWGKHVDKLSYIGVVQGRLKRIDTYGGKLTENIVQATARDILAHAMIQLEHGGYPIVLHVHDEIVSEVPSGTGDVGEFEAIMATLPQWCADWPIKAAGGWRGKRYRKD